MYEKIIKIIVDYWQNYSFDYKYFIPALYIVVYFILRMMTNKDAKTREIVSTLRRENEKHIIEIEKHYEEMKNHRLEMSYLWATVLELRDILFKTELKLNKKKLAKNDKKKKRG